MTPARTHDEHIAGIRAVKQRRDATRAAKAVAEVTKAAMKALAREVTA